MLGRIFWCITTIAFVVTIPASKADEAGGEDCDGASQTLIETYRNKLRPQFPDDVREVTELYRQINAIISSPESSSKALNSTEKKKANTLKYQIRSHILRENGEILASLLDGRYPCSKDYAEFIKDLLADFDVEVISAIFGRAIDDNLLFKEAEELAEFLWNSNKQYFRNDETTLTITLDQQLQLFWKNRQNGYDNDDYTFKVSYYFNQIKNDRLYSELDANIRRRLETAIRALPSTMQIFYFKPYFCLLNKKYKENIYTALYQWDSERTKVYSWQDPTWVTDVGYWQHDIKEEPSDAADTAPHLKFLIRSDKFKKYLYMDRNITDHNNVIAVWELGNVPADSAWSVQLVENHLVFSQDGYLMCNSDRFLDTKRRYVYGFHDRHHTKDSEECQWIVDLCDRYKI